MLDIVYSLCADDSARCSVQEEEETVEEEEEVGEFDWLSHDGHMTCMYPPPHI